MAEERDSNDLNRDPITDEPGAHPAGTAAGATAGGIAGAAVGAFAGPIGAAVGLVAGAVAGGLGGKAAAEGVNPTAEAAYWRETYTREPYHDKGYSFDDYGPAYEYGWNSRVTYPGTFETVESRLQSDWETRRSSSRLSWEEARPATRAAWDRVDSTYRRDAGNDANGGDKGDIIDTLNDLLENSRDGALGFREVAEHTKSPGLRALFSERAVGCDTAANELEAQIRKLGGKPAEGGTAGGAVHRGWVHTRGTLGGLSDEGMLDECERGEDAAVGRFRKALKNDALPADVRSLIERHAQGAQKNHDQIKSLREQYKSKA